MQFLKSVIEGSRAVCDGLRMLWQYKVLVAYILVSSVFFSVVEYFVRSSNCFFKASFCWWLFMLIIMFLMVGIVTEAAFYRQALSWSIGQSISIKKSFSFENQAWLSLIVWSLFTIGWLVLVRVIMQTLVLTHVLLIVRIFAAVAIDIVYAVSFLFVLIIVVNEHIGLLLAIKRSLKLGWSSLVAILTVMVEMYLITLIVLLPIELILYGIGFLQIPVVNIIMGYGVASILKCSLLFSAIAALYQVIVRRERHEVMDQIPPYMV